MGLVHLRAVSSKLGLIPSSRHAAVHQEPARPAVPLHSYRSATIETDRARQRHQIETSAGQTVGVQARSGRIIVMPLNAQEFLAAGRALAARRAGCRVGVQFRAEPADARRAALQHADLRPRAGQRARRDAAPAQPDRGRVPPGLGGLRDGPHQPARAHRRTLRADPRRAGGGGGGPPARRRCYGAARARPAALRPDRSGDDRAVRRSVAAHGADRALGGASGVRRLRGRERRCPGADGGRQRRRDAAGAATRRPQPARGAVADRSDVPQRRAGAGDGHARHDGCPHRQAAQHLA